ncbi:MAG: HNH endonuclease [Planctomycetota bacterium]
MTPGSTALNSQVLVLNKLWMAIRVIDARRAFSMLVRDMAEVIRVDDGSYTGHAFDDWAELSRARANFEVHADDASYEYIHTVRMPLAVPKIIRLLGYDRLPRQDVKLNRRNIFARDHNRCQYCGRSFATSELSLDHVTPRSQGGGTSWENLVCCCVGCNSKKGGRTPAQAQMPLVRPPMKPKRNPSVTVRVGHDKYASWRTFLDNAYWSVELQ